ncbi:hypothetical protein GCM10009817_30830 [Terrabacter lapilli]|uniref:Uncharacterized protein n=1 Tax=Terrabacter lapilli TaxID=436231 RepID=A0ABN2SIT3_9MICO
MTIDHHRKTVRVVHTIDPHEVPYIRPTGWPLELHEVLALASALRDAGYDTGTVIERIDAITIAINKVTHGDTARHLDGDLLDLPAGEVAERVRQAGIDRATYPVQGEVQLGFEARLAKNASDALRTLSDPIVAHMAKDFALALKAVQRAAQQGLTPDTDTTSLLEHATPAAITAYRALAPAVTTLDRIGLLRIQMADMAGIGPKRQPAALFLAATEGSTHYDGAMNLWRGTTEAVQYDPLDAVAGSTLKRINRHRLGGRWLALVVGGYQLRVNTAAQADAILADASL